MVQASREEACLAVRLYNDPVEVRSFEGFVVHMHMAWLYLLHGELTRSGVDFRYRRRDNPRLLEKVDGEPKRWDLARCVTERWPGRHPVRLNLEFFIGLRNRIEHRHAERHQLALATAFSGHAQALLLNYEEELTSQFGEEESLAASLRFPLFIGSFTDEGEKALQRLRRSLPSSLRGFIADYAADISEEVKNDPRFEFRLRVVNELAPRDPDALAIQFTRYDDLTEEEREVVEQLGRRGAVIVREQQRDVANLGVMKPSRVVEEAQKNIPFVFHMGHFVKAWKKLKVRPPGGVQHPERTDGKYCRWDPVHEDYGYFPAYIRKLTRELSSEEGFRRLLEAAPVRRPWTDDSGEGWSRAEE